MHSGNQEFSYSYCMHGLPTVTAIWKFQAISLTANRITLWWENYANKRLLSLVVILKITCRNTALESTQVWIGLVWIFFSRCKNVDISSLVKLDYMDILQPYCTVCIEQIIWETHTYIHMPDSNYPPHYKKESRIIGMRISYMHNLLSTTYRYLHKGINILFSQTHEYSIIKDLIV